jgi:Leucine-rich repeat (LRR) protein
MATQEQLRIVQKWLKSIGKEYALSELKKLQELDLDRNQLTSLPDYIGELGNLERLGLAYNQLTSLPDCIGELKNLKRLDLACNKLTSLPDCVGELRSLERLYIENNPNLILFEHQIPWLRKFENDCWKIEDFEVIPNTEAAKELYL